MSLTGQVDQPDQSVVFTKKRQGALLVQSNSSSRTTRRTPRHTRQKNRLSQSKGFRASFGRTFRRKHQLSQSHPSVGLSSDGLSLDRSSLKTELSAQPITLIGQIIFGRTFFGRIILRTNRRLSESHPSVGLSSDGLSSENQQDRTDFSYWPIRSF